MARGRFHHATRRSAIDRDALIRLAQPAWLEASAEVRFMTPDAPGWLGRFEVFTRAVGEPLFPVGSSDITPLRALIVLTLMMSLAWFAKRLDVHMMRVADRRPGLDRSTFIIGCAHSDDRLRVPVSAASAISFPWSNIGVRRGISRWARAIHTASDTENLRSRVRHRDD